MRRVATQLKHATVLYFMAVASVPGVTMPEPSIGFISGGFLSSIKAGEPFEALYEETRTSVENGEETTTRADTGRLFVDRDGRVRVETRDAFVTILDPKARATYVIDRETRQVLLEQPFPEPLQADAPVVPPSKRKVATGSTENLGTKDIEGLRCNGIRVVMGNTWREIWISEELNIPVLSEERLGLQKTAFRLFAFRFGDPSHDLFEVHRGGK